jgi:hypothetical protein
LTPKWTISTMNQFSLAPSSHNVDPWLDFLLLFNVTNPWILPSSWSLQQNVVPWLVSWC